jgi:hypothetical protein
MRVSFVRISSGCCSISVGSQRGAASSLVFSVRAGTSVSAWDWLFCRSEIVSSSGAR